MFDRKDRNRAIEEWMEHILSEETKPERKFMKTYFDLKEQLKIIDELIKEPSKTVVKVNGREITSFTLTYDSFSKQWNLNFSAPEAASADYYHR